MTLFHQVGCAQAISKVLLKCGYNIRKRNIDCSGLTDWMLANGKEEITSGGLIITDAQAGRI